MAIIQRSLSNENDKYLMSALAQQSSKANLHVTDLPYRLSSWALDDPDNIRLWFDENQELVAWAVLQTPFWEIDFVCHPALEEKLYPGFLEWAEQRAHQMLKTEYGHSTWFISVFSDQVNRIHDLEKAGFGCQSDIGEDSWSKVLMCQSVQTPVEVYKPPQGFIVRALAGENEVQCYVDLHRSVFETKNMTVEWRMRTLRHRDYKPDLDIVIESPDGRLVAFCICWFDEKTMEGRVEPLGCDKDFRHFALGRVALSEGLHRLQVAGAKEILVETDNYRNTAFRLYQSLDFEVIQNVCVFRKDFGGQKK